MPYSEALLQSHGNPLVDARLVRRLHEQHNLSLSEVWTQMLANIDQPLRDECSGSEASDLHAAIVERRHLLGPRDVIWPLSDLDDPSVVAALRQSHRRQCSNDTAFGPAQSFQIQSVTRRKFPRC